MHTNSKDIKEPSSEQLRTVDAEPIYRPTIYASELAQAIELEEAEPRYLASFTIIFCLVLVISSVIWSAFTQVNEVAVASGSVIPQGQVYDVQHLDGGVVAKLHVVNGDAVDQGDLLVSLDPASAESELQQMLSRRLSLELQVTRLKALIARKPPVFDEFLPTHQILVDRQEAIYAAQINSHTTELSLLNSQIRQRKNDITRLTNQVRSLKKELDIHKEQARMRETSFERGAVSRSDFLSAQALVADYENQLRQALDNTTLARNALKESEGRSKDLVARFDRDLALEAEQLSNELTELDSTLIRVQARGERQEIRAQVSGIVQALGISGAGAVVSPGEVILQLVPTKEAFVVEAKILPIDIGYVRTGQDAKLKFVSYDFARFGSLTGKLVQLSPSTYLDEEGQPYYRAEISLPRRYLGSQPGDLDILPGMTVTADIQTGQKSLLDYVLRPVTRGLDNAFHER